MRKLLLFALGISLIALAFMPVQAQGSTTSVYFLATGSGGTVSLFRWDLEGDPVQISNPDHPVRDYAVSPDGSMIAYSSDQTLWMQSGADDAISFADLGQDAPAFPLFSPDGSQVAYSDVNGLRIASIDGSSEPRLFLTHTILPDMNSAFDHFYRADQFVPDSNLLIVQALIWEGSTMGVLNLDTGAYQELPRDIHTNGLVTSTGDLLIYGNSGYTGSFDIQTAPLDNLEASAVIVDLNALNAGVLYVEQAVEIQPGIVRFVGNGFQIADSVQDFFAFVFDLDMATNAVSAVQTFALPYASTYLGPLSADGSRIALYNFNDQAAAQSFNPGGLLGIYNLNTGTLTDRFAAPLMANPVAMLMWQ